MKPKRSAPHTMSVKRTIGESGAKPKPQQRKGRAATTDWQRLRRMTDAQARRGAEKDRTTPLATRLGCGIVGAFRTGRTFAVTFLER